MANVNDIMNEIDRIEGAKSDLAGAIEEKGVEVPEGARINEYPSLVRQIEQGGTGVVRYDEAQTLSDAEKLQARENIGAAGTKIGVISQTQTWSGSGSNPRTYVMSGQTTGLIPQSFIDLVTSAGATFNPNGYQTGVGYFELNGLTDISYEEMQAIYAKTSALMTGGRVKSYTLASPRVGVRTNLPIQAGGGGYTIDLSGLAFSNTSIEVIAFNTVVATYSTLQDFCNNAQQLKSITQPVRFGTLANTRAFNGCYSLEDLQIDNLGASLEIKNSSILTLASVVHMVQNAANTSAITITLHATAYARCQADTTEYTYGGNTYTGIIALATAKNITIASA